MIDAAGRQFQRFGIQSISCRDRGVFGLDLMEDLEEICDPRFDYEDSVPQKEPRERIDESRETLATFRVLSGCFSVRNSLSDEHGSRSLSP